MEHNKNIIPGAASLAFYKEYRIDMPTISHCTNVYSSLEDISFSDNKENITPTIPTSTTKTKLYNFLNLPRLVI